MRASAVAAGMMVGLVAAGIASPAHADGVFTPFIGTTFSSEGNDNQTTYGVALGGYNAGVGLELDFGYTPDFFRAPQIEGDNNVVSLMVNLVVGPAIGENGRVYVTGGAGLLRYNIGGASDFFDVSRNDFGINVGGGFMAFFSRSVGVRGDLRYFRNVEDVDLREFPGVDLGSFNFWRATGGLALRW